jgi:hypothetical protein
MNQQERTVERAVSGLSAGHTMKEHNRFHGWSSAKSGDCPCFGNINKNSVYDDLKKVWPNLSLLEACCSSWPPAWKRAHPQGPRQVHSGAGDEHFQEKYEKVVSEDALRKLEIAITSSSKKHPCQRLQEDSGLAHEDPTVSYGGVGGGGLASQLASLQPFSLFCVGRIWAMGQCKVSQQNRGSDPEDKGGDGVPHQEHRGKGLQELDVQNRGCHYCWRQFW